MKRFFPKLTSACVVSAVLSGCAAVPERSQEPVLPAVTKTRSELLDLPPPNRRVDVAVYQFEDLTGQFEDSEKYQSLSKAVSQGGGPVLVKALREAGGGRWFRVVERSQLNNLLQERRIIQEMRQIYLQEKEVNPKALPPMLFAGILIEGGVVGYDSNVRTGGAGAALLGIGAHGQYRQDTLSVSLRAVSVKTGEILASVVVQKSLLSTSLSASVFRYVDTDAVLEAEIGQTANEPGLVALTRTIEKAVAALILEMADQDYWRFQHPAAGQVLVDDYLIEDGRKMPPPAGDQETEDGRTPGETKAAPSETANKTII
ncbi:CsgG/HfaB family protein [Cribrihabitans neustonicus]|uniref:CsgG/HfaB family protein n=1 Tax=Cribrihabitans neustonicus TaxID=1429085 RepID=UPI003B5A7EDE